MGMASRTTLHVWIEECLVKEIKELEMFSSEMDPYSFVSPSAYDTACVAMIDAFSDFNQQLHPLPLPLPLPMFQGCLDWVLNNQTEAGYWGECDAHGNPTLESLTATLACVLALNKWHVGSQNINQGLDFVNRNAEKLLLGLTHHQDQIPRWFTIVFPEMIELALKTDLHLAFPSQLNGLFSHIFHQRQRILQSEELVDNNQYPPLLAYFEALPSSYEISEEDISMNLSSDGSLFQSPAATARAFMATGKIECLAYLQSLVGKCANNGYGVPRSYPMDEELIKLCVLNQLHKLGLADHFAQEIEDNLAQLSRQETVAKPSINKQVAATQLQKDSVAFRLLRMHGYCVSPWRFCWFLNNQEVRAHIEQNCEYFSNTMLDVYRATDLMFPGEYELKEARSFSRKVLNKVLSKSTTRDNTDKKMMEHELRFPWMARLDRLEHRMWIEEKNTNILWAAKAAFHRLSPLLNEKLLQLAVADYEFRQSIYRTELQEVKRWSRNKGLTDMGFGREKTTYCYFAIASSIPLPYDSDLRTIITKSAVIITVADDFYDTEGSLDELNTLTHAIRRWDANGLSGHSKTIFDALDDVVREIVAKVLLQEPTDISMILKQIWYETFASWLVEAKWSKGGFLPSMDEYLGTGMVSIATHTVVLPASFLMDPTLTGCNIIRAGEYETVTKLLMVIPRLANDIQSYQKEQEEGKMNYVLLYLKENPGADIEDSTAYVRDILDNKWGEFLQHVLMDGFSDLPKPCKLLHLSVAKVFQMFFYSSNRYDSNTDMLHDIQKSIYIPLNIGTANPFMSWPQKK